MHRIKTAVLISGNGTNLQALIDASKQPDYPAEIVFVLSNKADAYGLKRAQKAGIATRVLGHSGYPTREAFDEAVDTALRTQNIELVCLAGFMRILSTPFVESWEGRMINIHPSLLPAYKGTDTHARVLEAKEKHHGATVHWVTPELDSGPTILQETLDVAEDDTAEILEQRVHELEHRLYPEALKQVAVFLRDGSGKIDAYGAAISS